MLRKMKTAPVLPTFGIYRMIDDCLSVAYLESQCASTNTIYTNVSSSNFSFLFSTFTCPKTKEYIATLKIFQFVASSSNVRQLMFRGIVENRQAISK